MVPEKGMLKTSQVIPYRHRTSGMNVGVDDNNKKHASSIQNVCYFFFSTINMYSCTHKSFNASLCTGSVGKEVNQTHRSWFLTEWLLMKWWQASSIICWWKKWENNLKCLEEFTAPTAPRVNLPLKKNISTPTNRKYSLPSTIFSGTRLSSFTKFKPKQRNIQCHLTATVLRGQRGVAVHWAASIEGEKDKQVFEKWWQKSQRSCRKLQLEWLCFFFEMCPVFSEDIWRYSKNAGAATATGHVFVYWTTSNATLTSVNGAGWHVSWGKVHVWHPREEGALLMITSLAGGFWRSSSPFTKAPFWGERVPVSLLWFPGWWLRSRWFLRWMC